MTRKDKLIELRKELAIIEEKYNNGEASEKDLMKIQRIIFKTINNQKI